MTKSLKLLAKKRRYERLLETTREAHIAVSHEMPSSVIVKSTPRRKQRRPVSVRVPLDLNSSDSEGEELLPVPCTPPRKGSARATTRHVDASGGSGAH